MLVKYDGCGASIVERLKVRTESYTGIGLTVAEAFGQSELFAAVLGNIQ